MNQGHSYKSTATYVLLTAETWFHSVLQSKKSKNYITLTERLICAYATNSSIIFCFPQYPKGLWAAAVWTHLFALCIAAGTPILALSTRAHDAMELADVCLLSAVPRGTKSWFFLLDSEIARVAHNVVVPYASCFTSYLISTNCINLNVQYNKITPLIITIIILLLLLFYHHHNHVHEGLGVFPVPWSSIWNWSLHLFLGRPMFLRSFDLYCNTCFGILFVSILCMCFSHFSWYCFISFTILCTPVFSLIH